MADRDDDMDYIEGEEMMEGDTEDAPIACSCPDCDEEAKLTCAGCGVAGYCSEVHMLSDWKNHFEDCNVCISGGIGAHGGVYWAAEVADEATDKANTIEWEPADMLHVRASPDGTLVEGKLNTDLLASMQDRKTVAIEGNVVAGGFKKMSVMKNGDKKSGLPKGVNLRGGDVTMRLTFAKAFGDPAVYQVTYTAPVEHLSDGSRNGEGSTFFVNPSEMARAIATPGNNTTPLNGMTSNGYEAIVTVWTPDRSMYQIHGGIRFVREGPKTRFGKKRAEGDFRAYTTSNLARAATRQARRGISRAESAIRKLPQLIRFTGVDQDGVEASIVMARSRKTGAVSYTVRSFGIHIPAGIRPAPSDETKYLESAYTESIATKIDADPEDLVHILALAEAIANKADETRAEYALARETVGPNSAGAKAAETKLTKEMRIHSVLMNHANTLRDEETGAVDLSGIPPEVEAAIGDARELIGISLLERWRRARDTMRARSSLSVLNNIQLKNDFLMNVSQLEASRARGDVGTQYLNRARAAREEILSARRYPLAQDNDIVLAMKTLEGYRSDQSAVRKGKRDIQRFVNKKEKEMARQRLDSMRRGDDLGNDPLPETPAK